MPDLFSPACHGLWSTLEPRIAAGISTHRMAQVEVKVVDAAGAPVPGAVVEAVQTGHAFHFGANCFILQGYDDQGLNDRYEQHFLRLFNAATVPFYWGPLEPQPGRLRFAADSERVWRRPPGDFTVDWCRRHNLFINGHTLVWDNPQWHVPAWMPKDPAECARLTAQRIRQLAQRYGGIIQRWDVLNERCHSWRKPTPFPDTPMPHDFDLLAFREAEAALPPEAILMINDYWGVFSPNEGKYRDLITELLWRGMRIDAIGLQIHNFSPADNLRVCRAEKFRPDDMLQALDAYACFSRPLHVSEITLAQPEETPEGEAAQAELVRRYYRLWFSHPLIDSITWWNVADGGAAPGETGVLSGLLDREHRPKAAYRALDKLINEEWTTRTGALTAGAEGCVRFRGFKGAYRLTASAGGKRAVIDTALAAHGTITITL